jgi:proteic killer suppression protein
MPRPAQHNKSCSDAETTELRAAGTGSHAPAATGPGTRRLLDLNNASRYYTVVIRSFRDRDTARLFHRESVRRWGPDVQRTALRKLRILDAATSMADLRVPPGNRLERLAGDRAGRWSIRVNDQWRLCFEWHEGEAHDVELVDYH